jgi:hypothetical protein
MRSPAVTLLAASVVAACQPAQRPPEPAALDPVATRYVELALGLGKHDPNYVDAYYGPDSRGARLIAAGVMLGALAFLMVGPWLRSQLFQLGAVDLPSMAASAVLALGIGLLACWWPAPRAALVDPAEVMRRGV